VDGGIAVDVIERYGQRGVKAFNIGTVVCGGDDNIVVKVGGEPAVEGTCSDLRDVWEATSFELEKRQRKPALVQKEQDGLKDRKTPERKLSYKPTATEKKVMEQVNKPKVCILRQEGTNGDREMSAAFYAAGFEPWDVTVSDLVNKNITLDDFRGLVACGGFSFADTLDSAKGWAGVIKYNAHVLKQFTDFRARDNTFALGVCNGCQLFALLGWVGASEEGEKKNTRLIHNDAGRFESRFSSVVIEEGNNSLFFKGMSGSSLGIWVAHGEGKFYFPDAKVQEKVFTSGCACVRYVDDSNKVTEEYPFNPNGSPGGVAALSSEDGRVLAIMPHPERLFIDWQWPYLPEGIRGEEGVGPWLKMFQNAREFCK